MIRYADSVHTTGCERGSIRLTGSFRPCSFHHTHTCRALPSSSNLANTVWMAWFTDSSLVIFLSQCGFGVALLAIPFALDLPRTSVGGWALMIGIGAGASAGQLMLTAAYKYVKIAEGAAFSMLTPVFNAMLGGLVFHEEITGRAIAGGVLVIGACVYAALLPRR